MRVNVAALAQRIPCAFRGTARSRMEVSFMDPKSLISDVANEIQKRNGDVTIEEGISSTIFRLGNRSIDLFDNNGRVFVQGTELTPSDPMPAQQYGAGSVAMFADLVSKHLTG